MAVSVGDLVTKEDIVSSFNDRVYNHAKSYIQWHQSNLPPSATDTYSNGNLSGHFSPGTDPGNSVATTDLSAGISGTEIYSLLSGLAYNLTKVRYVQWRRLLRYSRGGHWYWGHYDYHYAYAHLSNSYRVTLSIDNKNVETSEAITAASMNNFIEELRSKMQTAITTQTTITKHICHSSCHNSCHGSRGRR